MKFIVRKEVIGRKFYKILEELLIEKESSRILYQMEENCRKWLVGMFREHTSWQGWVGEIFNSVS